MSVSVFISYAVESKSHNRKVQDFANKLKLRGLNVSIFTDMKHGDRFGVFMERIRQCDFTLIICTPKYKKKADKGEGGVGYEWNIVKSSVTKPFDERKFIPILFSGNWKTSLPEWGDGKKGFDYRYESQVEFEKLIAIFEDYESQKLCEVLDCDGVIRPQNTEDRPFKERKMLRITNQWDEDEVVEVLAYFTLNSTGEDYIVYTKDETDENGNVEVCASKVIHVDENNTAFDAVSDQEWEEIKQVMLEIANED